MDTEALWWNLLLVGGVLLVYALYEFRILFLRQRHRRALRRLASVRLDDQIFLGIENSRCRGNCSTCRRGKRAA